MAFVIGRGLLCAEFGNISFLACSSTVVRIFFPKEEFVLKNREERGNIK